MILKKTANAATKMALKLYEIRNKPKYNLKDDFTIVIQPFFSDVTIPTQPNGEPDWDYFAPDCFHFSQKGHAASAVGLWNNMIERVGDKKTYWRAGEVLSCPAAGSFLWTNENSS